MMKRHFQRILLVAIVVVSPWSVRAQMGGPGGSGGLNSAMMQLFGKSAGFSAKSEIKISGTQEMTMPMDVVAMDGKIRTSTDMSAMKGAAFPPQAMAQMKAMGLDRMVAIMVPGQKSSVLIYPNMKAYVEVPVTDADATAGKEPKIDKTELGKETIDGHPTVKNKMLITDGSGKKTELTVWNATDLKDFPIKWEMTEGGAVITINYRDINTAKPDAKLFDVPAGFTKYANMQAMMMEMMTKNGAPK